MQIFFSQNGNAAILKYYFPKIISNSGNSIVFAKTNIRYYQISSVPKHKVFGSFEIIKSKCYSLLWSFHLFITYTWTRLIQETTYLLKNVLSVNNQVKDKAQKRAFKNGPISAMFKKLIDGKLPKYNQFLSTRRSSIQHLTTFQTC